MKPQKVYSSASARAGAYEPISDPYRIPKEEILLEKALAQLGGLQYCLVSDDNLDTIAIWRLRKEIDTVINK